MYNTIVYLPSNDYFTEFLEKFVEELLKNSIVYSLYIPHKVNNNLLNMVDKDKSTIFNSILDRKLTDNDREFAKKLIVIVKCGVLFSGIVVGRALNAKTLLKMPSEGGWGSLRSNNVLHFKWVFRPKIIRKHQC